MVKPVADVAARGSRTGLDDRRFADVPGDFGVVPHQPGPGRAHPVPAGSVHAAGRRGPHTLAAVGADAGALGQCAHAELRDCAQGGGFVNELMTLQ